MLTIISFSLALGSTATCPERYATRVVGFELGPGVEPAWGDPSTALGKPDFVEGTGAVSLGNQTGGTAWLTLSFGVPIQDGKGNDIFVYERGPSAEPTEVDVSVDGKTWERVGRIRGSIRGVDLAMNPALAERTFRYVRLTAVRDAAAGPWAGPDIDAVSLLNACSRPQS